MIKTNYINKILITTLISLLFILAIVSLYINPFSASAEEYQFYTGKNLFDINGVINLNYSGVGGTVNSVSNNILTSNLNSISSYSSGQFIKVSSNTYYTLSLQCLSLGSGSRANVYIYYRNSNVLRFNIDFTVSNSFKTISFRSLQDEILIAFSTFGGTGAQFTDIQFEKGSVATEYEPYNLSYASNVNFLYPNQDLTSTNVSYIFNNSYYHDYTRFSYSNISQSTTIGFTFLNRTNESQNLSLIDYLTVYIPSYTGWYQDFDLVAVYDNKACYSTSSVSTYIPTKEEAVTSSLFYSTDYHGNFVRTFYNINHSSDFYIVFYFNDWSEHTAIAPVYDFERENAFLIPGSISGDYSSGYNSGYYYGYDDGYISGVESGDGATSEELLNEYERGQSEGYSSGYNDGVVSSNFDEAYNEGYEYGYNEGYDIGEGHGEYEATLAWNGLITGSIGGFFGVLQDIGSIQLWSYSISSIWLGISTLMLVIVFLRMLKV